MSNITPNISSGYRSAFPTTPIYCFTRALPIGEVYIEAKLTENCIKNRTEYDVDVLLIRDEKDNAIPDVDGFIKYYCKTNWLEITEGWSDAKIKYTP